MKKIIAVLSILIPVTVCCLMFYLFLPPVNIKSLEFAVYILLCAAVIQLGFSLYGITGNTTPPALKAAGKVIPLAVAAYLALFAAATVLSMPVFHAQSYSNQVVFIESDFAVDIDEIPVHNLPVVDKDTAIRLGSRKLGEVVELVSQFRLDEGRYTQINYNGVPTRITPLEYADFFKWWNNKAEGIPYYMTVNMVTQEAVAVKLDEPIMYSPSEKFGRNLQRHIRFRYPTYIFDDIFFEIDDQGRPYWIAPVVTYDILFNGGKNTDGILLVDAATGAVTRYGANEIPNWIDNAISSELLVRQLDNHGVYSGGFWNSKISQKGVVETTDGHNYIVMDNDVWLYTGLTSVGRDESNIGFVLANKRTREVRHYEIHGAEEYSAMDSAQGEVQEKGYTATFPLLNNVANIPTYFLSLKDEAGLVKMYAFIAVQNYQVVGVGNTVDAAQSEYIRKLSENQLTDEIGAAVELSSKSGVIDAVYTAVKDGNSYYYLRLRNDESIYMGSIAISDYLPVLEPGDRVTIRYFDSEEDLKIFQEIQLR